MRLDGDALKLETPSLDGIGRGKLTPLFRLGNDRARALSYDLTYLVSNVRMIEGSIGSWVLDAVSDVKQRESVAGKSLYSWHQSGTLEAGKRKDEQGEFALKKPSYYVLEMEARLNDAPFFYQKIPFNCYPPIVASLVPIPSKEAIQIQLAFYGAQSDHKGKVRIDFSDEKGQVVLAQQAEVKRDEMRVPISMASLAPGSYKVTVTLMDPIGKEVANCAETFKKWETPDWLKDRKGIEALDANWVPAPWTPMQVSGDRFQVTGKEADTSFDNPKSKTQNPNSTTVAVWGRTFDFAPGSLLAGMTSQGTPLLAAGLSAKYRAQGKEHEFLISKPRFPLKKNGRVEVVQQADSPDFNLAARTQIEFDGLVRCDLTIAPKSVTTVEKLWIEIPFVNLDFATVMGNQWQTGLIDAQDFMPQAGRWYGFWIGTDKVGCSFFIENHKGWLIHSAKPRITFQTGGHRRLLQILIVNEPSEVSAPLTFTFALHPTPVKPFFRKWRDIRVDGLGFGQPPVNTTVLQGSSMYSGESNPSPRNWQVLQDALAYRDKRHQRLYLYLGVFYITPYDHVRKETPFVIAGNTTVDGKSVKEEDVVVKLKKDATRTEEYFYYKPDWDCTPPKVWDVGVETEEQVVTNPSGSWTDFFAHGIAEMLAKSDVDGFYFDIPSPQLDFNEEKGLVYKTKDGVTEGTYEVFATRDLYKRVYYLFDKLRGVGRKPYIIGHGFPSQPAIVSFWDVVGHGEELKPTEAFAATRVYLQKSGTGNPMVTPDASDQNRTYDAFYYRSVYGAYEGLPVWFLPQYGYQTKLAGLPELSRELLSFTFLHNNLLWPCYIPQQPVFDFWNKVEIPFGMGDTTFFPYWDNGVVCRPEGIKLSYWKKEGRDDYLVGVANWSAKPTDATIALPPALAGFTQCLDMEKGETLTAGKEWKVTVPAHDLRVFRFTGKESH
ncbi:MAG: hypothetical protein HY360_16500 [Verrucomicrobia bacterium]|nr:hypothetical protein [Verrucomicrobiota bacterium]